MPAGESDLAVAVTGPTGTLGLALMALLEADARVARVVGIARRPFDPAGHGWAKLDYRRGDVRDPASLDRAFRGVDVVVHLAFLVTGTAGRAATRAVNVAGSLSAWRAAAAAGARRFVYASSVAAYGFHRDNPVPVTEEWPVRPAVHLHYAQDKAEVERRLAEAAAAPPGPALYLLRPCIVLGPHTLGAKDLPGVLAPLGRWLGGRPRPVPVPLPVPVPDLPVQFVHEDDVGRALVQCIVGAGPPGAYNIAGDGVLSARDVARALGLLPLPLPGALARGAAGAVAALPAGLSVPLAAGWAEAVTHPAIVDAGKARRELGWSPRYTGRAALRATLRGEGAG